MKQHEMRNTLELIKRSLENNPNVIIAGEKYETHLGMGKFYEGHFDFESFDFFKKRPAYIAEFFVAPKNGLYTSKEMQAFMMSLIPEGLPFAKKKDFASLYNEIRSGYLVFKESIGTETITRNCSLIDQELFNIPGFTNGKRTIEETTNYVRSTYIRPFFNEQIAELVSKKMFYGDSFYLKRIKDYKSPKKMAKIKKSCEDYAAKPNKC